MKLVNVAQMRELERIAIVLLRSATGFLHKTADPA